MDTFFINLILVIEHFLDLFIESSPWLLLGLLIAGVIKSFVPSDFLAKHLGKNNYSSVFKAALFGAPLPLCSCGVIPAALGLRNNGASPAATTSFLISTPETGVDSVSVSYALLGPFMAIIRPVSAISTAIIAGIAVMLLDHKKPDKAVNVSRETLSSSTCCNKKALEITEQNKKPCSNSCGRSSEQLLNKQETLETNTIKKSCCDKSQLTTTQDSTNKEHITENNRNIINKLKLGIRYAFFDLVNDITQWLLIGLVAAAVILTYIPADLLTNWGGSIYAFIIMALIGVPMYICATASTPIAASMLASGVSPGAVLVFLLVGPATNLATLGVINQTFGKRLLAIYLTSVVLVGFLFGYFTNFLVNYLAIPISEQIHHNQHLINMNISMICSVILAALMSFSLFRRYIRPS